MIKNGLILHSDLFHLIAFMTEFGNYQATISDSPSSGCELLATPLIIILTPSSEGFELISEGKGSVLVIKDL